MTSTTKRRIAREWLIFLAAIVLGFFVTYGAFYLGRNTEWMNLRIKGKAASPGAPVADHQWVTSEKEEHARVIIDSETIPWTWEDRTYVRAWFSKPKNPGDMLNDMWPVAWYQYEYYNDGYDARPIRAHRLQHPILRWDYDALKLWLCILSPYLLLCFARSIIWSVSMLRRH
jgi:hypothetical protein